MIRAVVFDCFGVIITDALSVMTNELYQTNPEAEAQVHAWLEQANTGQITSEELTDNMSTLFGLSLEEYRNQVDYAEVKDGALLRYIAELRTDYKTAMLSNVPQGSLERRFTGDEFTRYFDVVIASGDIGYAKPEPEAYEIAADRLGVRLSECVFTDDRQPYVDGAVAVGMQGIVFQDLAQFRHDLELLLAKA